MFFCPRQASKLNSESLLLFPSLQNMDTCCDFVNSLAIITNDWYSDYYLDVKRVEAPKVDQDDDICPEVTEHFGDHPEWPIEISTGTLVLYVHYKLKRQEVLSVHHLKKKKFGFLSLSLTISVYRWSFFMIFAKVCMKVLEKWYRGLPCCSNVVDRGEQRVLNSKIGPSCSPPSPQALPALRLQEMHYWTNNFVKRSQSFATKYALKLHLSAPVFFFIVPYWSMFVILFD